MATKRSRRKATWMEISVKHAGFRGAGTALKWAYSWAYAREALGHDPTVDEVADWWRMSRRTAFRAQATFREAFPDLDSPAQLTSPEMRARLRNQLGLAGRLDRGEHPRREPTDSEILELGQQLSDVPIEDLFGDDQ